MKTKIESLKYHIRFCISEWMNDQSGQLFEELALALLFGCFGRIYFKAMIFERLQFSARSIRLWHLICDILEHLVDALARFTRHFVCATDQALALFDEFVNVSISDLPSMVIESVFHRKIGDAIHAAFTCALLPTRSTLLPQRNIFAVSAYETMSSKCCERAWNEETLSSAYTRIAPSANL